MSSERLPILPFLQASQQALLLDVRSPSEYAHAHIPGALSLPLFTDEERKEVGTTYKQVSREQAIKIGLDYFGPKMRQMVETVEHLVREKAKGKDGAGEPGRPLKTLCIYCWRGGMRSAAVSWLMNLYGFKVYTLNGGYKAFRNHVLQTFERPFPFSIIGGFTGSGKTELLHAMESQGERVIDLEGLASHKGSAFGNIDMPRQCTQEMFENRLAVLLSAAMDKEDNTPIWLEDESQRIGNINLPHALWNTMRRAPVYFLEIPFEERLHHLVEEYGCLNRAQMLHAVQRISKRLGGVEAKKVTAYLEEDNIPEAFRILLQYYDKRYWKALHNRENLSTLFTKISCPNVSTSNVQRILPKPMIA